MITVKYRLVETVTEERSYEFEADKYTIARFLKDTGLDDTDEKITVEDVFEVIKLHENNNTLTEVQDEIWQEFVDWLRGETIANGPTYNETIDSNVEDEDFEIIEESEE